MENKDTNTDHQKVVRVGDQVWEIVDITIQSGSFCFFVWDFYSLFFIQGVFKSHLKKITSTYCVNPHPKSQFDLSSSNISLLKNGTIPPSSRGKGWCELRLTTVCFFLSQMWLLVEAYLKSYETAMIKFFLREIVNSFQSFFVQWPLHILHFDFV